MQNFLLIIKRNFNIKGDCIRLTDGFPETGAIVAKKIKGVAIAISFLFGPCAK